MQRVGKVLRVSLDLAGGGAGTERRRARRIADAAGAPSHARRSPPKAAGLRATSDEQGRYEIRGLSSGAYLLRVRLLGYQRAPRASWWTRRLSRRISSSRAADQPVAVDVVVGSRARHNRGGELAVPVDVFTSEDMSKQGVTETGQILQSLAPSVNFPHQSVTDANDIVRPFTLRGLSPDETLCSSTAGDVIRWRSSTPSRTAWAPDDRRRSQRHSSSAIDRIDVLRDGASAQYGSDAIAGVVNMVLKEGSSRHS